MFLFGLRLTFVLENMIADDVVEVSSKLDGACTSRGIYSTPTPGTWPFDDTPEV